MDISCIFFGIVFTVSGILFALGKLHNKLEGWKNMTEEEKREINIVPLYRNIGIVIAICGVIFLVRGFWSFFTGKIFVAAMILWLVGAGVDLWHISKSSKYQYK